TARAGARQIQGARLAPRTVSASLHEEHTTIARVGRRRSHQQLATVSRERGAEAGRRHTWTYHVVHTPLAVRATVAVNHSAAVHCRRADEQVVAIQHQSARKPLVVTLRRWLDCRRSLPPGSRTHIRIRDARAIALAGRTDDQRITIDRERAPEIIHARGIHRRQHGLLLPCTGRTHAICVHHAGSVPVHRLPDEELVARHHNRTTVTRLL